jgi:hypothetical protein
MIKYLLFGAIFATVAALLVGIFGMLRGGEFYAQHGNALMRWRVIFQGCAIILFGLMFWLS